MRPQELYDAFAFPESCLLGKRVFKRLFLENGDMTAADHHPRVQNKVGSVIDAEADYSYYYHYKMWREVTYFWRGYDRGLGDMTHWRVDDVVYPGHLTTVTCHATYNIFDFDKNTAKSSFLDGHAAEIASESFDPRQFESNGGPYPDGTVPNLDFTIDGIKGRDVF